LIVTAIPEDWVEEVLSGRLSGPPPHDPLDWLGLEVNRLADDLALGFDGSDKLWAALAPTLDAMSNEELSARYCAIEAGLAEWGISGFYVDGGLICEWAGYPLVVIDLDLLRAQPNPLIGED
jgi:hypothetical protein